MIVKETDRLQSLMNRLLTPSRLPRVEKINIHEVTERVRTLLLAEFPGTLEVRRDYDTSLPDLRTGRRLGRSFRFSIQHEVCSVLS